LIPVTVSKFGGSALGVDGVLIGKIVNRIDQLKEKTKVVAVFSAPLVTYQEKFYSMTDVAIRIGRSYASSNPVELEVLRNVYERMATEYVSKQYRQEFLVHMDRF